VWLFSRQKRFISRASFLNVGEHFSYICKHITYVLCWSVGVIFLRLLSVYSSSPQSLLMSGLASDIGQINTSLRRQVSSIRIHFIYTVVFLRFRYNSNYVCKYLYPIFQKLMIFSLTPCFQSVIIINYNN
jgi:hypothetical protein